METEQSTVAVQGRTSKEAQKHVLFGLAGETYGIALLQLQEIIAQTKVTVLPNLPEHFDGVIGLRGTYIPILNLRTRFGFAGKRADRQSRILVVEAEPNSIGLLVDEVFRVVGIAAEAIGDAPELTCGQRTPYVQGVSELEAGRLVIHLNMARILSSLEQIQLSEISDAIQEAYHKIEGDSGDLPEEETDGSLAATTSDPEQGPDPTLASSPQQEGKG